MRPKTIVSVTPIAVERDSRTYKVGGLDGATRLPVDRRRGGAERGPARRPAVRADHRRRPPRRRPRPPRHPTALPRSPQPRARPRRSWHGWPRAHPSRSTAWRRRRGAPRCALVVPLALFATAQPRHGRRAAVRRPLLPAQPVPLPGGVVARTSRAQAVRLRRPRPLLDAAARRAPAADRRPRHLAGLGPRRAGVRSPRRRVRHGRRGRCAARARIASGAASTSSAIAHDTRLDTAGAPGIRTRLGLGADAFLLAVAGNFKRGMAVEPMLRALAGLPDRVHLAFVGAALRRVRDRRRGSSASRIGCTSSRRSRRPRSSRSSRRPTSRRSRTTRARSASAMRCRTASSSRSRRASRSSTRATSMDLRALAERYEVGWEIDPESDASIRSVVAAAPRGARRARRVPCPPAGGARRAVVAASRSRSSRG